MPVLDTCQQSFFSPTFLDPDCLIPGSVAWVLWQLGDSLLPGWFTREWRGHATTTRSAGRAAWPARTLFALHLLRWDAGGGSRLGACRRARTDLAWRAAMGLPVGGSTPTESTMREFESWLRSRANSCDVPRSLLVHEHLARRALRGREDDVLCAMDSTPMWCFGALKGTLRLLGDGLRGLARKLARALDRPLGACASDWELPWLTSRSMKGGLTGVDWRSRNSRREVVDRVARGVLRAVEAVRASIHEMPEPKRPAVLSRCEHLLKVIADDLEEDEEGRLVIARRVAADRLVSITDPEARSGRKTQSVAFKGYRLHILADLTSGVVLATDVVAAYPLTRVVLPTRTAQVTAP